MSARREKRLRALERRVEALETIAATPAFIHTQGDGKEDYVLEAVWSKETADTYPDKRLSLLDRLKNIFTGGHEKRNSTSGPRLLRLSLPTAAWTARGTLPSLMTRPRRSPTSPAWRTATASGTRTGM